VTCAELLPQGDRPVLDHFTHVKLHVVARVRLTLAVLNFIGFSPAVL
jgi:hypothetical protein